MFFGLFLKLGILYPTTRASESSPAIGTKVLYQVVGWQ